MSWGLYAIIAVAWTAPTAEPFQELIERIGTRLATPEYSRYVQIETEQDLDGQGKTSGERICKSSVAVQPDGWKRAEVLAAVENGKDVTGKVRRFREEREKKARAEGKQNENWLALDIEQRIPFELSEQPRYEFSASALDAGRAQIHFKPKDPQARAWVGDATVETQSGRIVQLHGCPAILPHFVDRIDIEMEFHDDVPGGTLPSRLVIEGAGHFLFFNKRMRYTALTSDFRH